MTGIEMLVSLPVIVPAVAAAHISNWLRKGPRRLLKVDTAAAVMAASPYQDTGSLAALVTACREVWPNRQPYPHDLRSWRVGSRWDDTAWNYQVAASWINGCVNAETLYLDVQLKGDELAITPYGQEGHRLLHVFLAKIEAAVLSNISMRPQGD
jgi:hypothetical protein